MHRQTGSILCTLLLMAGASSVEAQVARSGGGENAKFMQQYQQLAAEKTVLQAQNAQAKKDLDAAQAELAIVKKERDLLKSRTGVPAAEVVQLRTARDAADKSLDQYKQRMNELVGRFRETATNLKQVEGERAELRKTLDDKNRAYDQCAVDNLKLYELSGEILDRYDHIGLLTRVEASEPFTRITRARIDNAVDEYRERALELRAKKNAAP